MMTVVCATREGCAPKPPLPAHTCLAACKWHCAQGSAECQACLSQPFSGACWSLQKKSKHCTALDERHAEPRSMKSTRGSAFCFFQSSSTRQINKPSCVNVKSQPSLALLQNVFHVGVNKPSPPFSSVWGQFEHEATFDWINYSPVFESVNMH